MAKVLSVVCARSGSKGLRNKCSSLIHGRMVAEYALRYCLGLGKDTETIVSTDIPALIRLCKTEHIPLIERSPRLCGDTVPIEAVLADALVRQDPRPEYCSLVYGNIPTRYPALFHEALDFLESHPDFDACISMHNVEKFNPLWMFDLTSAALPRRKRPAFRRQELPQKMIHDGHTLLFRSTPFLDRFKARTLFDRGVFYGMFGAKIKPLLNGKLIVDIDTARDLALAEAALTPRRRNR